LPARRARPTLPIWRVDRMTSGFPPSGFAHLHLHTEFSLRDSTIRLPEEPDHIDPAKAPRPNLISRAVELRLPALAVTDLSNLFALVKFYRAAESAGIKPIVGADVFVEDVAGPTRLILLCQNREGYLSLSRLLSRGYIEGHHGDYVAIRPEWLRSESHGLIVLAGRDSVIGRCVREDRIDQAERMLREWQQAFDDRLYLEVVRTQRPGEDVFNAAAVDLATRHDLPLVASNDVRFLAREDFEAHEARVCIATGRTLDDTRRPHDFSAEQYLKSGEEMIALFADLPDAIENGLELAKRCNLELTFGKNYLPAFPVPSEHTIETWIRRQSHDGLAARLAKYPPADGFSADDYAHRLDTELGVIIPMDFAGYFLIVADFINWAKTNDIPVGPGRGSGAGSLVAYALGITDLDPIRYDLLFERFLNPERVSMPDFDIDFCMDRRDEVIDYVARKYGRDKVSQIITYGTMAAKAVVRDCGRVLGHPYGFVDSIAKLIPMTLGITLDGALGESTDPKQAGLAVAELIERYRNEDDVRDLLDLARKLEDLTRNAGKHAGGVVIAPTPLTDFAPLFAEYGGKGTVTQFDKDDVEAVGLVKFDFLGLRTLTIIDWAVKAINVQRAAAGEALLDIAALPLDDAKTYRVFANGDTIAVFQFESRGMRELLKRALPDQFEDLIALVSLFRPGPMDLIPDYIERKHGRQAVEYAEPRLQPILGPTYGIMIYQEQVMQIARTLGNYTLGGADLLRRAMGKKDVAKMAKERAKFEAGAADNGISTRVASSIFDLMQKFAGYGFNRSHAAAYALVAYQTAWLKQHYPAQFMAAVLSSDMDHTEKVVTFLQDARAGGLTVQPPDVNGSDYMFSALDAKTIRYGLGAIKGVGHGACEAISSERLRGGTYRDLTDFCARVDPARLNKRVMEALIQSGAMDTFGVNRPSLLLQLPEVLRAAEQLARDRDSGQSALFGGSTLAANPVEKALPHAPDWPLEQKLAGEHATLGHYLSGHPLDPYRAELDALTGCSFADLEALWRERRDRRGEAQVVLGGLVGLVRRKGDSMAFAQFEDGRGEIEVKFFRESYAEFATLLTRGRILLIEGALVEDEFNGGFSLRAKHCWDFRQLCAQQGRCLSMTLDLQQPNAQQQLDHTLADYRPGGTPLRLRLRTDGASGTLDLNGTQSVRSDPELLGRLRVLPGISEVQLHLRKPWAS
jgi:DNA polymerase-3 subunit alpha